MKFRLSFERLEMRDNPDATTIAAVVAPDPSTTALVTPTDTAAVSSDPTYAVPPADPIAPTPMPTPVITPSTTGSPGLPVADPTSPTPSF